jgi:hypothetical protein
MQRRIDEYRWHDMRTALMELREETHLLRARFADVYGFNRATVSKVEKIEKWPDYTPSEDVIKRWLASTSHEPLHEFMARYELAEAGRNAERGETEHLKKKTSVGAVLTSSVPPNVHTLPVALQPLPGEPAVDGTDQRPALSAEEHASILEQLALDLYRASAALRGLRTIRSATPEQSTERRASHPVGGPDPVRARRMK